MAESIHRSGGRQLKLQQIHQLIAQYRQSGLTQREFAARHGIGHSTFTSWLRKFRRGKLAEPASQPWLEVTPPVSPSPGPPIEYVLEYSGGRAIRLGPGFDPEEVAQLIELVTGTCSH